MRASSSRKVWILLSGCGLHDGTEVHEAAFAELAIARLGLPVAFCAPDIAQAHVVDHQRGDLSRIETRSVVIESARIARGPVESLSSLDVSAVEALVIPGGFGAVKSLCDYASRGRGALVEKSVAKLIESVHKRRAPIASMCMGNVLVARALGAKRVGVALGWDAMLDADCASWGASVLKVAPKMAAIDRDNRVASTPAFSMSNDVLTVCEGIERAVRAALDF